MLQHPLVKFGGSVSKRVGSSNRRWSHFWSSWSRLTRILSFVMSLFAVDTLTHMMNELNMKLQEQERHSFKNQSSFILKATVKQLIRSFPHTGKPERGASTCGKIEEISRRPAWRSLLPAAFTSLHTDPETGHRSFSWNSLISNGTPSSRRSSDGQAWHHRHRSKPHKRQYARAIGPETINKHRAKVAKVLIKQGQYSNKSFDLVSRRLYLDKLF